MNRESEIICEKFNLTEGFKELLDTIEVCFREIMDAKGMDDMTLLEWVLSNTATSTFSCLSEKERFLYGVGVLSCEIMQMQK